ncbi:MAG: hypothetical protein U0324_01810 [Polyangiales bacterium]
MGFRVDMHVVLWRDRVVVRAPRFGFEWADEPLVALVVSPAGHRSVVAVGVEARGPVEGCEDPIVRCNPVIERDLEVLEATLAYGVTKVWVGLPWWVRVLGERRVQVETAGFAHDEATRDAIASGCSSAPDAVVIDGVVWYGPSPHDFRLGGWRDGVVLGATLAFGAFVVSSGALDALRASIEREPGMLAPVVLVAVRGVHAVWWHARQQRRRAAQRERLMASRG